MDSVCFDAHQIPFFDDPIVEIVVAIGVAVITVEQTQDSEIEEAILGSDRRR